MARLFKGEVAGSQNGSNLRDARHIGVRLAFGRMPTNNKATAEISGQRTADGYYFVIDDPPDWRLPDYRVHIRGWCLHPVFGPPTGVRVLWPGGHAFGRYGEPRPDVVHAFQLPKEFENCGFKIPVALPPGKTQLVLEASDSAGAWHHLGSQSVHVPLRAFLPFWPKPHSPLDISESYETWLARYDKTGRWQRWRRRLKAHRLEYKPVFSVLLPTYNTPRKWLKAAIESVRRQSYPWWQLCISDDASPRGHVREILRSYAERDQRIRVHYREINGHISASTNSALALADGEFVALLDHDDELHPDALYFAALALNRQPDLDLIYSDEDKIDEHGYRFDPYFKSDWNPDLLDGQNCISHLGVFRTSRLRQVGGFREGLEGCQDWDVALRVAEAIPASRICHIPKVLYHWRAIPGSTALALGEKNYIRRSGHRMLVEHFERLGEEVEVLPAEGGHWTVHYRMRHEPRVSIVVPTRNQVRLLRRCIDTLRTNTQYGNYEIIVVDNQSTDVALLQYLEGLRNEGVRVLSYNRPFNYSAINNYAVRHATGEVLCFLNNDMEIVGGEWLRALVGNACRAGIGAVGAKLLFPDDTLQHTGIVLGLGGPAGHVLYKFNSNTGGYFNRARLACNYSAVTAACMAVRKEIFEAAGGFDAENLAVSYNDVDLCLRIQDLGYRNLYVPTAELYHHESASRGEDASAENLERAHREIDFMWRRWGRRLLKDPAYSPNLSLQREDYSFAAPPRLDPVWSEEEIHEPMVATAPAEWFPKPSAEVSLKLGRTTNSAAEIVSALYDRIMKRHPDLDGLLEYCRALRGGETVQGLITRMTSSQEFRNSIVSKDAAPNEGLLECYERLLARGADEKGLRDLTGAVRREGWETVISNFIASEEYQERFGEYTVPFPAEVPESKLTWVGA